MQRVKNLSPSLVALASAAFFLGGCELPDDHLKRSSTLTEYVGSDSCGVCHATQYQSWLTSHHAKSMQPATPESVLGNFDDATFSHSGIETLFRKIDGRYIVRTKGAAGTYEEFTIAYTFGVDPLQQYLIEIDGGRYQAFDVAWDTLRRRWFHLNPVVEHRSVSSEIETVPEGVHWASRGFNWNRQCADCHSTNVQVGLAKGGYETRFDAHNVACEACHGAGLSHTNDTSKPYADVACAPCHSRRSQIAEGFQPPNQLLDYYVPAPTVRPLYFDDGQIRDEVFVYGSFLQSRMHMAGVTCSDCHAPHSARLQSSGDALCLRCHNENPPINFKDALGDFDTSLHHMHPVTPIECIDCHMPKRTYMQIDDRHDHSLRVPRPDLSIQYGTPNACSNCHDQGDEWAMQQIIQYHGSRRRSHFSDTLLSGSRRHFDAERDLAELANDPGQPPTARANALSQLSGYELGYSAEAVTNGLKDPEPLVRLYALRSIERVDQNKRHGALKRLLADPIKAIRTDAARIAIEHLSDFTEPAERALILSVLEEYKAIQTQQSDLPEAHTNLAAISIALGQFDVAEQQLKNALAIEPEWIPGLVNLADLYRRVGRDSEAGDILEKAIAIKPPIAEAQIAYGMWLIRSGRPSDALNQFQRSYELEPEGLRNGYLYALALNANNRRDQAIGIAELAVDRFGDHRILLELLATMYRDAESFDGALRYATRLEERFGGDVYRALRAQMLLAVRKRDGPS